MKTIFDIQSGRQIGNEHSLLLEIGRDYCCYASWHSASHSIDSLRFITYNETEADDHLSKIVNDIASLSYQSVYVCSAFPQALLTPSKFFNENYEALDIVYNQPAQVYLHDKVPEWQMTTIYSVPEGVHQIFQKTFGDVQYMHAYTTAIKIYNGYVADNQMLVHFTPQYFRVILKKDTSIQLAQTYFYSTPLDVIYYLLKICYEFKLEQSSVFIILSGLIEKRSHLYKELEQYFTNVHFAHPPEIKLPDETYPHYFFTPLYNLATCVSSVEA